MESVWKYLIHTELAKTVYEDINRTRSVSVRTAEENNFLAFVDENRDVIALDFTIRVDRILQSLQGDGENQDNSLTAQRTRISERLHTSIIVKLREHLGEVLKNKEKVFILVDNLDSSWNHVGDLKDLSELLLALLRVIGQITHDFRSSDFRHERVNLSVVTFLRSDILMKLSTFANERDKIPHGNISWDSPQLLFTLIENRFSYESDGIPNPSELWSRFFCTSVGGKSLRQYVSDLIICRPRDIILLFKEAINEAISHRHVKVQEEDFQRAEFKYSQFACNSLLAERGDLQELEDILYEFVGHESIVTRTDLIRAIERGGVIDSSKIQEIVDFLCDLAFLGFEIADNKFEFTSEVRSSKILNRLSQRLVEHQGNAEPRYLIHNAYHAYLGVEAIQ